MWPASLFIGAFWSELTFSSGFCRELGGGGQNKPASFFCFPFLNFSRLHKSWSRCSCPWVLLTACLLVHRWRCLLSWLWSRPRAGLERGRSRGSAEEAGSFVRLEPSRGKLSVACGQRAHGERRDVIAAAAPRRCWSPSICPQLKGAAIDGRAAVLVASAEACVPATHECTHLSCVSFTVSYKIKSILLNSRQ